MRITINNPEIGKAKASGAMMINIHTKIDTYPSCLTLIFTQINAEIIAAD